LLALLSEKTNSSNTTPSNSTEPGIVGQAFHITTANNKMQDISQDSTSRPAQRPGEFLAFRLGNEEYGINILKVQEIRGYEAVTAIANAPVFIKGVVNLRGIIVPIVDLRVKFDLGTPVYDQFTVVIILNIGTRIVGIVVDSVSDVITLNAEQIRPAPEMGAAVNADYLIGLGTLDQRMLILMDIDKLMSSAEIGLIQNLAE
jgi:purine-binding chemotaxis protein CheW